MKRVCKTEGVGSGYPRFVSARTQLPPGGDVLAVSARGASPQVVPPSSAVKNTDEWLFAEQEPNDWIEAEREVHHMLGIDDWGGDSA